MPDVQSPAARRRFRTIQAIALPAMLAALYCGLATVNADPKILMIAVAISGFSIVVVSGDAARRLPARVVFAVVGGGLGVITFWAVWFGLEFGWPALWDFAGTQPSRIIPRLVALSNEYTYTIVGEDSEVTYGAGTTRVVWLVTTTVFGLSPLIGAFAGPRMANNIRKASIGQSPL
ncbi:hypothetical protein [Gymnodinialimonas sp. 57CJ19]|uniref:hypothetical protein n=1 Tax=Gymnodinialimonas sp. 57CJ19 TaxID=3138498 RepID=UPI0031343374